MSQERDKFIAEAVKDLDAEGKVHAAAELYVEIDADANEEAFSKATERLGKSTLRKYSRVRISMMVLLFVSFTLMLGVRNTSGLVAYKDWKFKDEINRKLPNYAVLYEGQFTAEEELLLKGSSTRDPLEELFSKMQVSLEVAEARDPQSSCFLLEYLSFHDNPILENKQKLTKETLNEKLRLAFERPYFKHSNKAEKQRLEVILSKASRADFAQRIKCIFLLEVERDYHFISNDMLINNLMRVKANENADEVRWWLSRYIHYLQQRVEWVNYRWGQNEFQRDINRLLPVMILCAKRIHWDEMVNQLELVKEEISDELKQAKKRREQDERTEDTLTDKKAMMSSGGANVDFTPGRYAEHAVAGRVFANVAWCMFGVILLITWLYRFIRKTKLTPLGLKFCDGLSKKEWLWILSGSILFPIAFYWVLTRYTDMSARDWIVGQIDEGFGVPRPNEFGAVQDVAAIDQFIALVLAILSLSICVVRWRLRVAFPVLVKSVSWLSWGMVIVAFSAMILAGFIDEQLDNTAFYVEAMLGIVGLYLVVIGIIFLVKRASVEKYLINRALTPVLASSALMMTILAACFYEEEKHYVANDPLTMFDTELGMSVYEAKLTMRKKKKLQAMLDHLSIKD